MEKLLREKGFWQIVAVVCAGGVLALVCMMTFGGGHVARQPIPERLEQGATLPPEATLVLSEEQLQALLTAAVPEELGLRDLRLTIRERSLALSATGSKTKLLALVQQANRNAGTFLHTATSLLPETVTLGTELGVAMEDGRLTLTPQSLTLGNVTLSAELLPRQLSAPLRQALSAAAESAGGVITDISLSPGVLTVTLG